MWVSLRSATTSSSAFKMQIFVRCSAPTHTVTLDCCSKTDCVHDLKVKLSQSCYLGSPEDMVLVHAGRCMQDELPVSSYRLQHGSTIQLTGRLRGGGGDGGSTGAESRSCYLEMYAQRKPDKVNPAEELQARWTRCHLTGELLNPPCVIDELGTLYNKDAIVSALLNKTVPDKLAYITGLKSVVDLKLEPNSAKRQTAPKAAERGASQPGNDAAFCCPITGLEFNGRFKFMAHRKTGLTVSEKAVKEVPAVVSELLEGASIVPEDWIPVNPPEDQLDDMRKKLAAKLAAEREKKAKKKAAKASAANGVASAAGQQGEADRGAAGPGPSGSTSNHDSSKAPNGVVGKRSASPDTPLAVGTGTLAATAGGVGSMLPPPAKKPKALEHMPNHATKSVYASIFTSSRPEEKESYLCRSTSARGVHLT